MTPQEAFVGRLKRHRERGRIPLETVARESRIKWELLEAFERNDLSQWPRGLYARSWIRAYASVVGLDPIDTVDEFCRLFPHGDRRVADTMRGIAAIVAQPSAYREELPIERRQAAPRINVLPRVAWYAPVVTAAQRFVAAMTVSGRKRLASGAETGRR